MGTISGFTTWMVKSVSCSHDTFVISFCTDWWNQRWPLPPNLLLTYNNFLAHLDKGHVSIIRHSFVIHCLSEICKTFSRLINIFLCINHYCFARSEVKYIRNIFFFHFRLYTRYQKRTRLNFGTKLGMNSPF